MRTPEAERASSRRISRTPVVGMNFLRMTLTGSIVGTVVSNDPSGATLRKMSLSPLPPMNVALLPPAAKISFLFIGFSCAGKSRHLTPSPHCSSNIELGTSLWGSYVSQSNDRGHHPADLFWRCAY